MPRPSRSQFPTTEEFQLAHSAWHMKLHEHAQLVDKQVEEQYDIQDGGDLCYNLMDMGEIDEDSTVEESARIVAQRIEQA